LTGEEDGGDSFGCFGFCRDHTGEIPTVRFGAAEKTQAEHLFPKMMSRKDIVNAEWGSLSAIADVTAGDISGALKSDQGRTDTRD
jgi:hypothetical protein